MKVPDWIKKLKGDVVTVIPNDFYSASEVASINETTRATAKRKLDEDVERGKLVSIKVKQGAHIVTFYGHAKKKTKNS